MRKRIIISGAITVFTLLVTSCNKSINEKKSESKMEQNEMKAMELPTTQKWVKSPVRNRLVLELDSPVEEVWALVGDPSNMSKYSGGLDSVISKMENGKCVQYTCYFKPTKETESGYVHTEEMLWHEENKGWASRSPEPNALGYTDYLSLLTLEDIEGKTKFTWYMTCNHEKKEMIDMNTQGLLQAFDDIGNRLVKKFKGKILENYSE